MSEIYKQEEHKYDCYHLKIILKEGSKYQTIKFKSVLNKFYFQFHFILYYNKEKFYGKIKLFFI